MRRGDRLETSAIYDAQKAAHNIATPRISLTGYELLARRQLSFD
jgi:hypothetical protein